ncbi:MAG: urea ABC transporter permease subunit UrtC [Chthoniobacter sp.]|nr:urea ABC transporter permease subunit UrtC [Chthoniobacter sp.]
MKRNISKIELVVAAIIALFLVVGLPLLNVSGAVGDYQINLWGKYLCYGLLAISVDLLWGYTGLLSLGQALFYSLGGYMLGMNLMLMIGKDGQYYKSGNNPNLLPDFMVFLGHTFLPSFWRPFYSFPFAVVMVVAIPGLLALIFGFFAFRSRIKGVYFSILTQALTYAAYIFLLQNDVTMGGNNGFTDFKRILGFNLRHPATQRGLYIATAAVLVAVYAFSRWLTTTKFGLVQRAIRDSETRVLFSGYAAANYKLFIFVIASCVAALGGALYVPQVGIINPSELATDKSLEAVVWCAVGGRGTIVGPIIGAICVNWLKSWATTHYPDYWLIILGVMFILIVLFLPKGIYGLLIQAWNFLFKPKLDPTREIVAVPEVESAPAPEIVGTPSK